jgi:hypothetical protein
MPSCRASSRTTTRALPKPPRDEHDAHRALRADEDLDLIFCWRELRKVTKALTLHYERKLYLLADTAANRRLIGKYIEVFQYPDGRIEIRVAGSLTALFHSTTSSAPLTKERSSTTSAWATCCRSHKWSSPSATAVPMHPSTAHRADGHHRSTQ